MSLIFIVFVSAQMLAEASSSPSVLAGVYLYVVIHLPSFLDQVDHVIHVSPSLHVPLEKHGWLTIPSWCSSVQAKSSMLRRIERGSVTRIM
jgi:hypothetical protein